MELQGQSLLGFSHAQGDGYQAFHAIEASTGQVLEPDFHAASHADVERAATLAEAAFPTFRATSSGARAAFLRLIADGMDAGRAELATRAELETGLPPARLNGEIARTTGQLRLFAALIEDGSWVEARLDSGDPSRAPLPKPDLRSMLVPVGPTVVFGASNFPFAYSVAGGDTASALAAGCPVIVKAHPAHPGTSEIVGRIVQEAAQTSGMPEGTFSLLFDDGIEIGLELVRHPTIKAVGFTGSRQAGRALMDAAAARPEPIPVYAEMSSVNPLFVLTGALGKDTDALADGLCASISNGVGQFCTKPGLIFVPMGLEGDRFVEAIAQKLRTVTPLAMLTTGIGRAYDEGVSRWNAHAKVEAILPPQIEEPLRAQPALFQTSAREFMGNRSLMDEVFGPAALVVRFEDAENLREMALSLEGQLTFSLHGSEEEIAGSGLVPIAIEKSGRIVFGGFPTGVEVGHAIIHGGPFPATSDGRTTSVGTRAITRFARYVAFQNAPQSLLPPELRDGNPLGIVRMVDGQTETA
jgi:alpha-ketoglutaric semialdehyde dehydrogenase